jgi:hypothetical protein
MPDSQDLAGVLWYLLPQLALSLTRVAFCPPTL